MNSFKHGDKVFHCHNGVIYKGTGVGTVVGVNENKVIIKWSNKKKYRGNCTDNDEETMLLDSSRVFSFGNIEVYIEPGLTADEAIESVLQQVEDCEEGI